LPTQSRGAGTIFDVWLPGPNTSHTGNGTTLRAEQGQLQADLQ